MSRLHAAILTVLLLATGAGAQVEDRLRVTLTPASGSVADRFTLRFELLTEPDASVIWPAMNDEDLPNLRVVDAQYPPLAFAGPDRVRIVRLYTLEPNLPGDRTIPAFDLSIKGPSGDARIASSEPIAMEVRSLLDPDAEIPGLEPARPVVPFNPGPDKKTPIWLIVGAASACTVVVSVITVLLVRRSTPPVLAQATPAERRTLLLARLQSELSQPLPDVPLCLRMIDRVIRLHIEDRSGIDRAQATNDDLTRAMSSGELLLPPAEAEAIGTALQELDAARFSGVEPNSAFVRDLLKTLDPIVTPAPTGGVA